MEHWEHRQETQDLHRETDKDRGEDRLKHTREGRLIRER